MYEKDKIKLDAISGIDEEIIDKATAIRWEWIVKLNQKVKRSHLWLRVVALAACFCLVLGGGILGGWMLWGNDRTPDVVPPSNYTVPTYTGMTVQNEAPMTEDLATMSVFAELLPMLSDGNNGNAYGHQKNPNQDDPYERGEKGEKIEDAVKDALSLQVQGSEGEYFSRKNEDVYFLIHIENPDDFEILSFTLNGTKYSSYMFEKGSDMETLVLKYNVGDVEGVQEYTIDAIKYVDGEQIKDVRMEGERTVRVTITPEEQPMATVSEESIGITSLSFAVALDDPRGMVAVNEGKLLAVLYDGENIVLQREIALGETVSLDGLVPCTLYQYAVVAVYDAIDGGGVQAHVLAKKAFYTESAVGVQIGALEGVSVPMSVSWQSAYTGQKDEMVIGLYEEDTLLRTLSESDTQVDRLPFDKDLHVRVTYEVNGVAVTERFDIESPQSTEGLVMIGDEVTGFGSCSDTVLYINAPIRERAFRDNHNITALYLGEGCEYVGGFAFQGCDELTTLYLAEGITYLGDNAFQNSSVEEVTLPSTLRGKSGEAGSTAVGKSVFASCANLKKVTISEGLQNLGGKGTFTQCTALSEVYLPSTLKTVSSYMFFCCESLQSITLPEGLEVIEECAFASCNLQNVKIPTSVKHIGEHAF